jgi:hypothetical protein
MVCFDFILKILDIYNILNFILYFLISSGLLFQLEILDLLLLYIFFINRSYELLFIYLYYYIYFYFSINIIRS